MQCLCARLYSMPRAHKRNIVSTSPILDPILLPLMSPSMKILPTFLRLLLLSKPIYLLSLSSPLFLYHCCLLWGFWLYNLLCLPPCLPLMIVQVHHLWYILMHLPLWLSLLWHKTPLCPPLAPWLYISCGLWKHMNACQKIYQTHLFIVLIKNQLV